MFNLVRLSGLAALVLGLAGAPFQISHAQGLEAVPTRHNFTIALPPVEDGPTAPTDLPVARIQPAVVESVDTIPAATSLSALVHRHSNSAAANAEEECLAGAVYFESKGEPLVGQLAVAQVILNRAASGRFARTACGVVHQAGQFSFVRGDGFPPIARQAATWRTAVAIAHIAQQQLWDGEAPNALYFHARRVSPNWRMTRVAALGNHIFYR